jgi:outer membrane protein assembly factor BamB
LAVIGNVVAVTRSGSEPEVQFVDLFTGEVLWRSNAERAGEVVWHGDVVIDEGNVYGTNVRTGQRSWEIRVDQDGDDEFTPWVMPRELWAGEKVLLRSSEDRITALKLS